MRIIIDTEQQSIAVAGSGGKSAYALYSNAAFRIISREWLKIGWNLNYWAGFSWFGLRVLQLPEDLLKLQETVYKLRPDVIVEVGIYQGGGTLFFASLCELLGHGRVLSVDLTVDPEVRHALAGHRLARRITIYEGDSCSTEIFRHIEKEAAGAQSVLIFLDSDHSKEHVLNELDLYSRLVTPGSYIIAADGVMQILADTPKGKASWKTDNPAAAAREFATNHPEFLLEEPPEIYITESDENQVTYFPDGWLRRIAHDERKIKRTNSDANPLRPWVRVVIVNDNAGTLLASLVDALARQSDADFEAVIVDNPRTDGPCEACALPDERFRVLRVGGNLGFAAGCNLGCGGAATPWVATLSTDVIPDEDWLAELKRATLRHPEGAMFGSTQVEAADPTILVGAGDPYSVFGLAWRGGRGASVKAVHSDVRVFSPCAAAALYRRDVFESTGGFAESFFYCMEDVDLGFRLNLSGHEAIQVAAARVRRVGSASSSGRASLYQELRSSVYVVIRCAPFPLVLLMLPLMALSQVWIGIRTRSLGARMEAVSDGLRWFPELLRQRKRIQARRRISIKELCQLLVWSPRQVNRLAIVPLARRASGRTEQNSA